MSELSPIEKEVKRVTAVARGLIETYGAWPPQRQWSNYNTLYGDLTEFVNLRVETIDSMLLLANSGRVADALGLGRSVLEHALLLRLMCRGFKYIQLQDFNSLTPVEFKEKVASAQADLAERHARGECRDVLSVGPSPKGGRQLMWIVEGLRLEGSTSNFRIPSHYFSFQDFDPFTHRLHEDEYFKYLDDPDDVRAARKRFRQEAAYRYQTYLSYDALLRSLQINDIIDDAAKLRIEAHYTFLGTFLHPTHDAARDLHENSNSHTQNAGIGLTQKYTAASVLLAALYATHLLAEVVSELVAFFDQAPPEYLSDTGTAELHAALESARKSVSYFWFIDNEPPDYQKFLHAMHHVSDADLANYGDYTKLPADIVKFHKEIYSTFAQSLDGWSNIRVGTYRPPIPRGKNKA